MEVRIGVPHMGNFYIAFEALVRELGITPIIPPRPSRANIEFGISHSPEFICFPFKATSVSYTHLTLPTKRIV